MTIGMNVLYMPMAISVCNLCDIIEERLKSKMMRRLAFLLRSGLGFSSHLVILMLPILFDILVDLK